MPGETQMGEEHVFQPLQNLKKPKKPLKLLYLFRKKV